MLFSLKEKELPWLCPLIYHQISFLPFRASPLERTIHPCYFTFHHQAVLVKHCSLFAKYNENISDFILQTFQLYMTTLVFLSFLMISPNFVSLAFFNLFFLLPLYKSLKLLFPRVLPSTIFSFCPLSKSNLMYYWAATLLLGWWLTYLSPYPSPCLRTSYLPDTFS